MVNLMKSEKEDDTFWDGFCGDQDGQTVAEYGLLVWLSVFIGTVTLAVFIFAFEQAIISYYRDIVNIIALPLP